MESTKALLIINPISGTRHKRGLENFVCKCLESKNIDTEIFYTKRSGDAYHEASRAACQGYPMVITAGGDGTVNEAANGLAGTETVLGILPYGSGNGLARSLGIPQDLNEAMSIIKAGYIMDCDRGVANGNPFYCTFGIGFDAAVSEKFAMMGKRGKTTYIRSALEEFLNYKSETYALLINGKVITEKALLIAVCNAPQYGNNAYIGPKAKLTDGLLDITVVHDDNPFSTILMVMDLMTGNLDKNRSIGTFQVPSVTIARKNEGPVHLDGEPLIMGKNIEIKCQRKALKVFAPEKERPFIPFISPLRAMIDDVRFDVKDKFRNLEMGGNLK